MAAIVHCRPSIRLPPTCAYSGIHRLGSRVPRPGIGANTALFSLINAALIRLIPVQNPQELVWFHSGSHGRALSYPFYELIRNDERFNGILSAFPTPVS